MIIFYPYNAYSQLVLEYLVMVCSRSIEKSIDYCQLGLDPDASPDEQEEKARLISQVLELQNTLDGEYKLRFFHLSRLNTNRPKVINEILIGKMSHYFVECISAVAQNCIFQMTRVPMVNIFFRSVTKGGQREGGKSQVTQWKSSIGSIHREFNVSIERLSVDEPKFEKKVSLRVIIVLKDAFEKRREQRALEESTIIDCLANIWDEDVHV